MGLLQNVDSWIRVSPTRGIFDWHLTSKHSTDHPNATWMPVANETARSKATNISALRQSHASHR